jgi:hypothetical protein
VVEYQSKLRAAESRVSSLQKEVELVQQEKDMEITSARKQHEASLASAAVSPLLSCVCVCVAASKLCEAYCLQADHARENASLRAELDLRRQQELEAAMSSIKVDLAAARQSLRESELRLQDLTLQMETRVAEAVADARNKEVFLLTIVPPSPFPRPPPKCILPKS